MRWLALLTFIGNTAWSVLQMPLLLLVAIRVARSEPALEQIALCALLIAFSAVASILIDAASANYQRLHSLKVCLRRLERSRDALLLVPDVTWLPPALASRFFAKDRSKAQTKKGALPNYRILIPRKTAKQEVYVAPQAYPNYREESIIIIPALTQRQVANSMYHFLLLHELEHCTDEGLKAEYRSLAAFVKTGLFFCVAATGLSSLNAFAAAIGFLIVSAVENTILRPALLEALTDLRAISLLNKRDVDPVAKDLVDYFNGIQARPRSTKENPSRGPSQLEVFIRRKMGETVAFVAATSHPSLAALEQLASRPISGCLLALPALWLFLQFAFNFRSFSWIATLPYAVFLLAALILQGQWGEEGDIVLEQIRLLLPSEVANSDVAHITE